MKVFSSFWRDRQGGVVAKASLMTAAVALAALASAQLLQHSTGTTQTPMLAGMRFDFKKRSPSSIDYSSTASIDAGCAQKSLPPIQTVGKTIQLDPCTGSPK
jgi:hypothetical protein